MMGGLRRVSVVLACVLGGMLLTACSDGQRGAASPASGTVVYRTVPANCRVSPEEVVAWQHRGPIIRAIPKSELSPDQVWKSVPRLSGGIWGCVSETTSGNTEWDFRLFPNTTTAERLAAMRAVRQTGVFANVKISDSQGG